jgi:hypothetical protein
MRRVGIVFAAALGLSVTTFVAPTPPSVQASLGSVVIDGTGNGHGRGLSQYGAYGWAVDHGRTHSWILDHYYGGTVAGGWPTGRLDVRLLALDGVPNMKVISATGSVNVVGVPGSWGSVLAIRTGSNQFQLWGSPAVSVCNTDTTGFAPIGTFPTAAVLFATPGGDDPATPAGNLLGVCRSDGSVIHYRGSIEYWDTSSGTRTVNSVFVEQYLRGVLPREVPANWGAAPNGIEALKAQAVAARSYGLRQNRDYRVQPGGEQYATTCDSSTCQVYGGAADRSGGTSPGVNVRENAFTNMAVDATPGEVRLKDGALVSTEFSSSNGPRTAGGTFPVRDDPADATPANKLHRWTRVLDAGAIAARYGLGTLTSVSTVEAADPVNQQYDGIWYNDVLLVGAAGTRRVPAWTFRNDMGLPSPGFVVRGEPMGSRPMAANQRIELQVVGSPITTPGGAGALIPSGTSAVALNITAVGPSTPGFATVWPCDVGRPDASNLNFGAGVTVANGVIAPVGPSGKVCFYSNSTTHFLVDVAGYFAGDIAASGFVGVRPDRKLDTRNGIGGPRARIPAGGVLTVPMAGAAVAGTSGTPMTIPGDAGAVAVNVTAVGPARPGFLTVWPCGAVRPTASNVNFGTGGAVANGVVASLGAGGAICVYSDAETDVLVDVLGWFGGGGQPVFVGAVPSRAVDTRNAIGGPLGVLTPAAPRAVPVRGVTLDVGGVARQVPADATAVAVNVTMVEARAAGFATVWPCGSAQPDASNVNFARGATVANGVVAPIGPDGSICIATSADAHLLVDIAGWFTGGSTISFAPNIPKRLVDTRNNIGPTPQ